VGVRWADRQHQLLRHVANQVANGATRNMIVRRCSADITEDEIREDLDHIYNMRVINVDFLGASAHIQTNSIQNAIHARSCMLSRKYVSATYIMGHY
jgi:hypothetical protein